MMRGVEWRGQAHSYDCVLDWHTSLENSDSQLSDDI